MLGYVIDARDYSRGTHRWQQRPPQNDQHTHALVEALGRQGHAELGVLHHADARGLALGLREEAGQLVGGRGRGGEADGPEPRHGVLGGGARPDVLPVEDLDLSGGALFLCGGRGGGIE